jgi:hypothetical protein
VVTLGEMALDALFQSARRPSDPVLAKALLDVADGMLVGERYDAVVMDIPGKGRRRRRARIDGRARRRLRRCVESAPRPASRPNDLVGSLMEADFERHTARLRTPAESAVEVTFTEAQADDIQAALRQASTVRGRVSYDPKTHAAKSVLLEEILPRAEQLELSAGDFWSELSFQALAERQLSGQPVDPADLYDDAATEEERDAVIAALAELD